MAPFYELLRIRSLSAKETPLEHQLCRGQPFNRPAVRRARAGPRGAAQTSIAAIRSLSALADLSTCALLVLPNFHRFLNSAEIIQAVAHQIAAGKQDRTFIVVLSPVVQIPTELEKHFVVIEHELPGRDQLEESPAGSGLKKASCPEAEELNSCSSTAGLTQ